MSAAARRTSVVLQQVLPPTAIAAALLGIAVSLPLLHIAPNRLVVGTPIAAVSALGSLGWLVVGLCLFGGACLGGTRSRIAGFAALAAFSAALVVFGCGLGRAAGALVADQPPAARVRLASGGWAGLLLLSGMIATATARTGMRGVGWLTLAGGLSAFASLCAVGVFDGLSLAVEYRARASNVHAAVLEHVQLSGAAVALAAVLSLLLYAWLPVRGAVEIAINGLQVVPAVALLGALVALTSGLLAAVPALRAAGLSALGPGPAIAAVAAYLLLPFWRGLEAALRVPTPATVDAAAAMGLSRFEILVGLRLPLGAPILIGALRVASVQGIGLATLGALVGAGGLGSIVFDGMAQFAPDLILLGALPVIGLSLMVERTLSLLEDRARRRWHS